MREQNKKIEPAESFDSFESLDIHGTIQEPILSLGDFSGPLDLLLHLIKRNKFDIFDLPISELTEQYLSWTKDLSSLELEQASEFLLMASELLEMKSKMLLPNIHNIEDEEDPRTELTLRLLAYRRTKYLAETLEKRQAIYENMAFRQPMTAKDLGLSLEEPTVEKEDVSIKRFQLIADHLAKRNEARYQDVSEKLKFLTQRERIPLRERMAKVWTWIKDKGRTFFHEISPETDTPASRVASFLSVLELMRQERIRAKQKRNFAPIFLTYRAADDDPNLDELEDYE